MLDKILPAPGKIATVDHHRALPYSELPGFVLKLAEQHNISRTETDVPADELPDSEMFLLGRPMLQARLENLQAVGPDFDLDYDQNRAMLNTLNVGPTMDPRFQTYRYLRTPEEPVKRDSPRRAFLMIMWGIVGALTGAGVALTRRRTK